MKKRRRIWHVGRSGDLYRTAIRLWRGYRIHIFWRGDRDIHPHDHPNDFWTFPLRGYWEDVFDPRDGRRRLNYVKPFRWHFRPAEYAHRVLGATRHARWIPDHFTGGFITLVKEGPEKRRWGFWVQDPELSPAMRWIYWRKYLGEEG